MYFQKRLWPVHQNQLIKPTNVKSLTYNGSMLPTTGSCILNISTKNEIHSVQFVKVIDSNSPSIIGIKTNEDLNLLNCLSNINVNNEIDICTEYADCFREIGLLKNR